MGGTNEYKIESVSYFFIVRLISNFDYFRFSFYTGRTLKFQVANSIPKIYFDSIPVYHKIQATNSYTFIKITNLERKRDGTSKITVKHYINFFNKFSVWISTFNINFENLTDSDFNLLNEYVLD